MAADRPYGEFYDFYSVSPEYFGYHLVYINWIGILFKLNIPPEKPEAACDTSRHTTLGRTPLDRWSARRRFLYLTKHNTHNIQTIMPQAGFEPTVPASERPLKCPLVWFKYQGNLTVMTIRFDSRYLKKTCREAHNAKSTDRISDWRSKQLK
jgi:hypothetical protein